MIFFSGQPPLRRRPIRKPSTSPQWCSWSTVVFLAHCTSCAQSLAPSNPKVPWSTMRTSMDAPRILRYPTVMLFGRKNDDDEEDQEVQSSSNDPSEALPDEGDGLGLRQSTIRIDDGGSNLTDRFKYKVNALMGAFDPADAAADTEHENGNILNAMLTFPLEYTFHVVGRTAGDDALQEQFVQQVKDLVQSTTENDEIICRITPRGTKFTKVTVQVQVVSSNVIASIYEQLGELELSVMQF